MMVLLLVSGVFVKFTTRNSAVTQEAKKSNKNNDGNYFVTYKRGYLIF